MTRAVKRHQVFIFFFVTVLVARFIYRLKRAMYDPYWLLLIWSAKSFYEMYHIATRRKKKKQFSDNFEYILWNISLYIRIYTIQPQERKCDIFASLCIWERDFFFLPMDVVLIVHPTCNQFPISVCPTNWKLLCTTLLLLLRPQKRKKQNVQSVSQMQQNNDTNIAYVELQDQWNGPYFFS